MRVSSAGVWPMLCKMGAVKMFPVLAGQRDGRNACLVGLIVIMAGDNFAMPVQIFSDRLRAMLRIAANNPLALANVSAA